jgi:hypothetical protein
VIVAGSDIEGDIDYWSQAYGSPSWQEELVAPG